MARSPLVGGLLILLLVHPATAAEPTQNSTSKYKAPPAFEAVLKHLEAHGEDSTITRISCLRYCDAAPTGGPGCKLKGKSILDGNKSRSLSVYIGADRGDAHVILTHRDTTTGEIHIYGVTRNGELRKVVNRKQIEAGPMDLAKAEQDESEKGYKALFQYWVNKEPELRP